MVAVEGMLLLFAANGDPTVCVWGGVGDWVRGCAEVGASVGMGMSFRREVGCFMYISV